MRLTTDGEDDFGKFTLESPGRCDVHGTGTDAVIHYAAGIKKSLLDKGINPISTLVAEERNKRVRLLNLGVTCGCYAKFHRQVAHIEDKRAHKK